VNGNDVVVYVDAGYVRQSLRDASTGAGHVGIDTAIVADILRREAIRRMGRPVHRQRWYDGVSAAGPTPRQLKLASTSGVVLRQGLLVADSSHAGYHQKAVDTLLVRDMVVDAIGGRISDMVLCSGDADMIPGVREAIDRGVRVHLWGIGATDERAYARALQEEVGDSATLAPDLFADALAVGRPAEAPTAEVIAMPLTGRATPAAMPRTVVPAPRPAWEWERTDWVTLPIDLDNALHPYQLGRHYGRYWYARTSDAARSGAAALTIKTVPSQVDGSLLVSASTVLRPASGMLTTAQRTALRRGFVAAVTECADTDPRSAAAIALVPPTSTGAMFH
jgi:uncharacterized LabA/DUF88 family protein